MFCPQHFWKCRLINGTAEIGIWDTADRTTDSISLKTEGAKNTPYVGQDQPDMTFLTFLSTDAVW